MIKRKMVFLTVFLVLLASLALGVYYINKAVLPTVVKEQILSGLSELTGTKVTLESLKFNPFRGVVISNLAMADKDEPGNILLSVKDTSAGFLIISFIKDKKIIIPSLKLNSLKLNLIRQKDGSLSIARLIDKLSQPVTAKDTPAILVRTVNILDSTVHFTDSSFEHPAQADIDIDRLNINLHWQKITATCEASISRNNKKTTFRIRTDYSLASQSWYGGINAGPIDALVFKEYTSFLPATLDSAHITGLQVKLTSDKSIIKTNARFNFEALSGSQNNVSIKDTSGYTVFFAKAPVDSLKDITVRGNLFIKDGGFLFSDKTEANGKIDKLSCDYTITPDDLDLTFDLRLSALKVKKDLIKVLNGAVHTTARMIIPFNNEKNTSPAFTYAGSAEIRADNVSGLRQIGPVSDIETSLQFINGDIAIQKLALTALDTRVNGSGSLKENILNLDIEGDFDLERLAEFLPKDTGLPRFEVSGTTEAKAGIALDISKDEPPVFKGEAALQNLSLVMPENNISLESDTGSLIFDTAAENLRWHFDSIRYLNAGYSLDGNLKNFKVPEISAMLIGADIKVKAELIKKRDALAVTSASGSYKNTQFDVSGKLDDKANLSASGTINLDAEDLKYFLPQNKTELEKMGLKGRCTLRADASGSIKNWPLWDIAAKGNSSQITCYGLKFQNVVLEYDQKQYQGFLNLLSFDAYRGKGVIKGRLEFLKAGAIYSFRGLFNNIDLGMLRIDTPLKEKVFYGLLDLNISANGRSADLKTLSGGGNFTIKEGNIWEFNPLQGLGNFIFSPGFSKVSFTNAQADFSIQNGHILTDNLELLGPQLGLICEGSVGFDGKLDLLVNTQLPAAKGMEIGDAVSRAGSLTAIKITGTAKEPKYKLQPIGENIVRKVGEIFSNILP